MMEAGLGKGMMDYSCGGLMSYGHCRMWGGPLLVIAIILLIYLIYQYTKAKGTEVTHKESPIEILNGRYAKGEITKEEYEIIKKDLGS